MLDPRIYRTGLVVVALAILVVAFSLENQPAPATTGIPPDAFNGQNAYVNMVGLARRYPDRRPGSPGDGALATAVATSLQASGYVVSTTTQSGRTADGQRALQTVSGVRTGLGHGAIVIVSHRDALGGPAEAELSGTAVMLELARVLAGETQQHTIIAVSTSGSAGGAGAAAAAAQLAGTPVDAVLVLGDLAGSGTRQPIVVPYSNGEQFAPLMLRNTLATTLQAQAGLSASSPGLGGQFARLALPLTMTGQGPFNAAGMPAVLLSLSGERAPATTEPVTSPDRITALGRAVLQALNALDGAGPVPPPSPYLLLSGKVIPAWAVRLLTFALLLPVLMTTVDGFARARRRGYSLTRWIVWVLAGAVPFLVALVIVRGAGLAGAVNAPPGPVLAGVVPLDGAGTALLVGAGLAIIALFALRPVLIPLLTGWRRVRRPTNAGAGAAVLMVMSTVALAVWAINPFAALLIVPALHLWMWVVDPDRRTPRTLSSALVVIGLLPPALVVLYYARVLGLAPGDVVWNGTLLIAGGHVGLVTGAEWSVLLGCAASVVAIIARTPGRERSEHREQPVTMRGPVSYAGPGSLGGTESALRR